MTDPLTERTPWARYRRRWARGLVRGGFLVGNVVAWILLSAFYLVILMPYGVVMRLVRADPLAIRARPPAWRALPSQYDTPEEAARQ